MIEPRFRSWLRDTKKWRFDSETENYRVDTEPEWLEQHALVIQAIRRLPVFHVTSELNGTTSRMENSILRRYLASEIRPTTRSTGINSRTSNSKSKLKIGRNRFHWKQQPGKFTEIKNAFQIMMGQPWILGSTRKMARFTGGKAPSILSPKMSISQEWTW